MKLLLIIIQITGLFIFQFLGESISNLLNLPIPGSIVGLLLLFLCLHFKVFPEKFLKVGVGFLLALLPLFYIPSVVGIVQYPAFLSGLGVTMIGITMVSTFLTMIVVGRVSEWYEDKNEQGKE